MIQVMACDGGWFFEHPYKGTAHRYPYVPLLSTRYLLFQKKVHTIRAIT
jgi:hypothetical protein